MDGAHDLDAMDHMEGETIIRSDKVKSPPKEKKSAPKNVQPEEVEGAKPNQPMPSTPPKPMADTQSTHYRSTGRYVAPQPTTQPAHGSYYRYPSSRYQTSRERQL